MHFIKSKTPCQAQEQRESAAGQHYMMTTFVAMDLELVVKETLGLLSTERLRLLPICINLPEARVSSAILVRSFCLVRSSDFGQLREMTVSVYAVASVVCSVRIACMPNSNNAITPS